MGGQYNTCSVIDCTNSRKRITNLPMFRVPKDPLRSKNWITNSGRKELLLKDPNYLHDNIRFCAFHFEDSQFTNSNKNRLIWNAVPTLFGQACEIGLDQTKITDYESLINLIENKRKTNSTFIVLKKVSLPKYKSLRSDLFKPNILRRKVKAIRQIECQSPVKNTATKCIKIPTDKVKLLTELVSQKSECQSSVKQMGNNIMSNPANKVQIKLRPTENNSLLILNSNILEYKKKVDAFKRKICIQKNNSLNRTSKPSSFKRKCENLQINKSNSSANLIEAKDTENPTVDVQESELGKSLAYPIETKDTTSMTNEVDMQENKGSANHTETNKPTICTDEVDIKKNKGQSSANHTETIRHTNPTDELDIQENKCQSSANRKETYIPIDPTDEVDMRGNKGQSSANHAETNRPTNHTDEVNMEENKDHSSTNHTETNRPTNHIDEVNMQENKDHSSANRTETNRPTNHTDEVDMQENKGQSSASCIETTGTNTTEVNIQENEYQYSVNCIETNITTSLNYKAVIHENEGETSTNCVETKVTGTKIPTDKAVIQEYEGQSSASHIESMSTTNYTTEVDTQTNSGSQINEHKSSVLLSPEQQTDNKRMGNLTDQLHVKLKSPENNSFILNCDSSQNKKKMKVVKRKSILLKNCNSKKIHGFKLAIPKKTFEALKENECLSSAEHIETKNNMKHTDKVDQQVQENSNPKIIECFSLLKNCRTKNITSTIDKVHQVKLGQQKIKSKPSILIPPIKHVQNKRISASTKNIQTMLNSPGNSNSLLINDDFSQYKKRVEDFKKKLCSPNFNAVNSKPLKRKLEDINESESSLGLKVPKNSSTIKYGGVGELQVKSGPPKNVFTPLVQYSENSTQKIHIKPTTPESNSLITKSEVTKFKKKAEALEKIMAGLKTDHKAEVTKLKKTIKALRRKTLRKDFLISKLRKDLKDCSYYVRPNSKPNFQRDRRLIETILSKYVGRDTLNIVMSQIRKPTTNFGNRWDDGVKMFALNIFQSSPKAYKILCSYLHLPSSRTLQKFVQGADLMALSGLNHKISSDVTEDNEDDVVPENSFVDADNGGDTAPEYTLVDAVNEDMADPEMIASVIEVDHEVLINPEIITSVVEVETENILHPECIISQDSGEENGGQIFYVVSGTDNECEVVTEDCIPAQASSL